MKNNLTKRILDASLLQRVVKPDVAAERIKKGMTIGTAGGFQFGYPKTFFSALVAKRKADIDFKIDLWAGGPVGEEIDGLLSENGMLGKRLGQHLNLNLRKKINDREIFFSDLRSGIFPQQVRSGSLGSVDVAVIEAVGITREGNIIPSTSLFDGATFVQMAKQVIVEINTAYPLELEGIHDVYILKNPPDGDVIPIRHAGDRIGTTYIPVDKDKIACIIEGTVQDRVIPRHSRNETSQKIGKNLVTFFQKEVDSGKLPENLFPLQMGLGNIADSFSMELDSSTLKDLTIYSGGIGDGILDLIDSGKIRTVSTSGLYFSTEGQKRFFENLDRYKEIMIIRPLDIADSPEVIHRLGVIATNTAVEIDIYGHVNSSHVQGSKIISGIGGSGEFAQNSFLSIFLTPATSRKRSISAILPMVSHCDHTEHTVDIIVTDQGVADLRGLEPVERARSIIRNCAHPDYRSLLTEYLNKAIKKTGGHEPHLLEEAFSFHTRFSKKQTMLN
ncbi:MAG: acetyl-CoA hydrolase/transferase C-terminal domain-containing protein [Desulfatiglandales bacterium]